MNFLGGAFLRAIALPSSSGSKSPTLSGLLDPKYDDTEMLGNLGNYLLIEDA
jgi:hypothetical protein